MAATAEQVARLRRLVAEPTQDTYTDEALAGYIERYPLKDERGQEPYTWDTATQPPTQETNEDWIPTYDLNAAAADLWDQKAAGLAPAYDFTADGASYRRSQAYEQALRSARYFRARRSMQTIRQRPEPLAPAGADYVANRIPNL